MDITLNEVKTKKSAPTDIPLSEIRKKKVTVEKQYEIENKEVSKNIKEFDKRPRVYTENPYSFNAVSLGKFKTTPLVPSAEEMVSNSTYNAIGKVPGLDTTKEWNQYYDKVFQITQWAKEKTKTDDLEKLIKFIGDKSRVIPSLGSRRIDDIYIHSKLSK